MPAAASQGAGRDGVEAHLLDEATPPAVAQEASRSHFAASGEEATPDTRLVPMDEDRSFCGGDGVDGIGMTVCGGCLSGMHAFFMMLPVVIVMFLLTLVDCGFLIYEFASGSEQYEWVTLFTSFAFFVELLVHLGHLGPKRFFHFDRNWMIAECVIVTTSFVVEYVEFIIDHTLPQEDYHKYVAYMRAARFLRVGILAKTRSRTVIAAVRRLVSADRRRYQQDGYDLDLTYVHPHVIAMSWPSEKVEAMFRNHIDVVARFLDERHNGKYVVYNLCSERSYDESKFHDRVVRYRLDDHNPGELSMLLEFGAEVKRWIDGDPSRVAVIHCKGGKGRTGTMVCSYLLYAGIYKTATAALQQFGEQRTSHNARSFQGVESPSQERYVRYLERLLNTPGRVIPTRRVRITKLVMYGVPKMFWDIGKLWFAIVTQPCTDRNVAFVSNPTVTFSHALPTSSQPQVKRRTKTVAPDGSDAFGIEPFYGNMAISVRSKGQAPSAARLVDGPSFIDKYCPSGARDGGQFHSAIFTQREADSPTSPSPSADTDVAKDDVVVDVEFSTSSIPPLEGDCVLKFFHNVDQPNTLKCPLQIWFHPSFEGATLHLKRDKVDGPHKDTKGKKYSKDFAVEIGFETVRDDDAKPPTAADVNVNNSDGTGR